MNNLSPELRVNSTSPQRCSPFDSTIQQISSSSVRQIGEKYFYRFADLWKSFCFLKKPEIIFVVGSLNSMFPPVRRLRVDRLPPKTSTAFWGRRLWVDRPGEFNSTLSLQYSNLGCCWRLWPLQEDPPL